MLQVEEEELKKRESNAQRYVQRKGLMLNVSANNYTESSKVGRISCSLCFTHLCSQPMGLDFAMEGDIAEQLAKV